MSAPFDLYRFRPARSPETTSSAGLQSLVATRARPSDTGDRLRRAYADRVGQGVLVLFEAVNAGGKDGVIEELVSVLGAASVRVERFGRPVVTGPYRTVLDRVWDVAPRRGELVFLNRSYYGAPLHAAVQGLPSVTRLCDCIARVERTVAMTGTALVKVFLHIDKSEQLRRLINRQNRPELRHLHNPQDFADQERWDDLMRAYGVVMTRTHTVLNPWFVIPSNERAVRNNAVQEILVWALRHGVLGGSGHSGVPSTPDR